MTHFVGVVAENIRVRTKVRLCDLILHIREVSRPFDKPQLEKRYKPGYLTVLYELRIHSEGSWHLCLDFVHSEERGL